MTWPALDLAFLADAAATFNFRLGVPTPLAVTPDGSVLFRRSAARGFASDLFELTAAGEVRTLVAVDELLGTADEQLSDAEKARRERTRTATRGVVDIGLSEDGATVMIPLGGVFHLIDRAGGGRTVVDPAGPAYDPRLSPDGRTIAFVRDGDLWRVAPGTPPQRLTAHPEGLEYGVAEFVAQEELGRARGYWWSPDSAAIVFQTSDVRGVDTLHVSDPRHPERPPVPFKYPRAGRPNAVVELGVIDAAGGGEPRWLTAGLAGDGYLVSVQWPRQGRLTAVVIDREQTHLRVLALDPATGAATPLLDEHDPAWLNVNAGAPRWLPDGSGFLWMTEQSGAWTLELRDAGGARVRALTEPGLGLRRLAGVDDAGALVVASADPLRQDVYRIPTAGGPPVRLSRGDGVASLVASGHGVVVIDTALAAGGRAVIAVGAGGERPLPSVAEQPALVPTTALETVLLDGRTHHVAITRPRDFDPARRYPVLLKVYGGPHVVTVTAARDSYLMDQWYADAGFIVVRSDNRGTPNRGRDWERAILRDLIAAPLADQVAALQAVGARHPELDLARVGVTGWSFGGYLAAMAALLRPDVFHAAVAGAPVTDWSFYDTAYTERFMKTPQANPDGYARTSALTHAAGLARPLLLIHGITDDNVHLAHTLALIEALYLAARRAEVITLSATHMVPDPRLSQAREQVQVDFFRQHL